MAIRKVGKVKTIKKVKRGVLSHKLQKMNHVKYHKPIDMRPHPLTVREHRKALDIYKKHFKDGVTIQNALDMSLDIDFKRMREDLTAVYIMGNSKGMMTFNVKASGKYMVNKYGVASNKKAINHEVNISFDVAGIKTAIDNGLSSSDILYNTPIAFQCDCGRHTYWYRYTWTIMGASIGIQEKRFPSIRNRELKGLFCKHGIRTVLLMKNKNFVSVFERYLKRVVEGRQFRFTDKNKQSFAGVSMFS